jgi:hypothetical protein
VIRGALRVSARLGEALGDRRRDVVASLSRERWGRHATYVRSTDVEAWNLVHPTDVEAGTGVLESDVMSFGGNSGGPVLESAQDD